MNEASIVSSGRIWTSEDCVAGFEALFKVTGFKVDRDGFRGEGGGFVKGSPEDATTAVDGLTDWLWVGRLRRTEGGLMRWGGGPLGRDPKQKGGLIGLGPPLGLRGNLGLWGGPDFVICSDWKEK